MTKNIPTGSFDGVGDSEVVLQQVRGEYGLSESTLRPLHARSKELADEFEQVEIQHISREVNKEAGP